MALQPKVLIVDEPTRGIDIGAKAEVHQLLFDMARSGMALIIISSEMPEVLALSDRIAVFREGCISGMLDGQDATETKLMELMAISTPRRPREARRDDEELLPEQGTATRRFDAVGWLRRYGTSLFLLALIVFFAVENSRFLSLRNVTNILTEVSIYGIIAVGMTFVILTAGWILPSARCWRSRACRAPL